jgi:cysteine dioxygenase
MMLVQTICLAQLVEKLDAYDAVIPREVAEQWLLDSDLSPEDVEQHVSFQPELYTRATVKKTANYELLVVSWGSGQWSTLHDHSGSICAFRIVEGQATELHFETSEAGYIFPTETARHQPGSVQSCTGADIHQLCNLEKEGLVSVHIYSPPLTTSKTYGLEHSPFGGYAELSQKVARRAAESQVLKQVR